MAAAMALIEVGFALCIVVAALLVLVFDALSRVLIGAGAALARVPWRGGRYLIRSHQLKLSALSADNRPVRQCPTCRRIYPKTLGQGGYCSVDCELSQLRRIRSAVRLRRLARIVAPG